MKVIAQLERLDRLSTLIRRKSTGSPEGSIATFASLYKLEVTSYMPFLSLLNFTSMKKRIYYLCVAVASALFLYSCKPEPKPPKNIEDLGPIETREGEENIPFSYLWSGHTSLQIDGKDYSFYPSADLNIKGEKGVDYRYFVVNITDIETSPMKVFDILTDVDIDPVPLIEQFLKDPNQVGQDFKGTIVVSLPNNLEVEQAKIYNNGVAIDYGYGFQIRKDIEEHGLVSSEQEDVIELRNEVYCSDFYLVIYELDTGNIISHTFLYQICHGTGGRGVSEWR